AEHEPRLSAQALWRLADFLAAHPDPELGRRWLLEVLTTHIEHGGELVGEFEAFRAFAEVAVDLAFDEELRQLAVTPEGEVRLGVAKALAWLHQGRESMYAWRTYLEDAAEQPDLGGDAQARWLLARAYAAR